MAKKGKPRDRQPLRPKGVLRWKPLEPAPGSEIKVWSTPPPSHPYWNKKYRDAANWAKQTLGLPYEGGKGGVWVEYERNEEPPPELKSAAEAILHQWGQIESSFFGRRGVYDLGKLDKLITEAQKLVDHASRQGRPGGKARGRQQTEERQQEWKRLQDEANKIRKGEPNSTARVVYKKLKEKFPTLSERTFYRRVKLSP